jgi:hypothetical protein
MVRQKTWKVLEDGFVGDDVIFLQCRCGYDAAVPTRGELEVPIIAIFGMRIVFEQPSYEPPDTWMPHTIQCRNCRKIFTSKPEEDD